MAYDVLDIARYVINTSIDFEIPVSNLKLQKVLYYIQAAFLAEKDKICFDEPIVKWRHGPVVERVYHEYKTFQNSEIDKKQLEYKELKIGENFDFSYEKKQFDSSIISLEDQDLIKKVILSYSKYSPWELVKKTHEEAPWEETKRNEEIDIKLIQDYYKRADLVYGK